jgi:hypothetical protein
MGQSYLVFSLDLVKQMQLLSLENTNSSFSETSEFPEWDELDLSTSERRKERMEILICQKAQRGEDITQCLQVLDYLKRRTGENKLYDILTQQAKERSIFHSLQRVCITSFALLGMIALCHGVLSRTEARQSAGYDVLLERNLQQGDSIAPARSDCLRHCAPRNRNGSIQGQLKTDEH